MESRQPVWDRSRPACDRRAQTRGRASSALPIVLALALVGLAPAAVAGDNASTAKEGGLGSAAAISSLVYGPVKLLYATGGTVASGLTWLFSGGDGKVAKTVLTRSVRGNYVITPEMLQGQQELEFVGRAPEYREAPPQIASAPEAW
jgi:hypothetical protein